MAASTAAGCCSGAAAGSETTREYGCLAEEVVDAQVLSKSETLRVIETFTLKFLQAISKEEDPELYLASRLEKNVIRDEHGHVHLGNSKTVKKLFGRSGTGVERYTKIWQVLALIQKLLLEGKVATQREAYYCLVQYFKNQGEFNDTLQEEWGGYDFHCVCVCPSTDVVALTGCARSSLGICASSSGAIAGCLLWQEGGESIDCSNAAGGKRIPGVVEDVGFESLGARYILVVEKDAVFTYLCGQRIWNTLPCILVTGCGYPPLSVRAVVKKLVTQFSLPVVGLFDYNPHGVRILLTYKFGSTRMGLEAHSYAVDIQWLGVHYSDLFNTENGRLKVEESALQQWSVSDQQVYSGVLNRIKLFDNPFYLREMAAMEEKRVKAEIEALNCDGFDSLEKKIIQKILRRNYF